MPRPPYPHMMPRDVPLFTAFVLSVHSEPYRRWQFDLHVGSGYCIEPCPDPALRRQAMELTRLRIDAVGWDMTRPTLFEVKPDARSSAIGQLVSYRHHFRKEYRVEPRLGLITDTMVQDIADVCEAEGIGIYIVDPLRIDIYAIRAACFKVQANCTDLLRIPIIEEFSLSGAGELS